MSEGMSEGMNEGMSREMSEEMRKGHEIKSSIWYTHTLTN